MQAVAILVLLLGIWLWIRRRPHARLPRTESISLITFMALLFLSSLLGNINDAKVLLGKIWVLLCFFPMIAFSERLSRRLIGELLLWGTVFSSAIGIGHFFIEHLDRAEGLSGGYTTLALFEAGLFPMALVFFSQARGKRKWLYLLAMAIMGFCLFLTETRAGWLAALIGFVFTGYYLSKKATVITLVAALVMIAVLPQTRAIIAKRMETNKPGGVTSGRAILWNYSLVPLSHLPFFGYGPGSFTRLMPADVLAKTGDPAIKSWHSTPLETLIESGPLALLALLSLVIFGLVRSWKNYFRASKRLPLDLGLLASLIAIYFAGLSTNLFRDLTFISFLALLWSAILIPENKLDKLQVSK